MRRYFILTTKKCRIYAAFGVSQTPRKTISGRENVTMKEGRLGYNSYNKRYGLLSSDLWIDTGFHCGECLEVLLDDERVQTRMEMNPAREWYLVGTPYCGDLEYIRARIPG